MKRYVNLTVILSVSFAIATSISALSPSTDSMPSSVGTTSEPVPTPTPKKIKKSGKVTNNLGGDNDLIEVRGQTPASSQRSAAPSNTTASPKSAKKPGKITNNLGGDNDLIEVRGQTPARSQNAPASQNRTSSPKSVKTTGVTPTQNDPVSSKKPVKKPAGRTTKRP